MNHWRDHLDSSLLGAYSLYDGTTDKFKSIDGYVLRCTNEEHLLGASGKRKCLVAYTSLDTKKPMKINVTIAKQLAFGVKSQNPDKWVNIPVTFYVDENVKTKDGITEALRLRVRQEKPIDYTPFEMQLRGCTTLDELGMVWNSANFPRTKMEAVKNDMKNKLTPKQ